MCGITGIYSFNREGQADHEQTDRAISCLKKRGPDLRQVYTYGPVSLGHSRLSIIDISPEAIQPFTDAGLNYFLVFNGEIFNFRELKEQLQSEGESFHSHSDTEVLFKLLIKKGSGVLTLLNGFFAFAFYDKKKHTLLVARDRTGEKPLYWSRNENHFYFASELKSILQYPLTRRLNEKMLKTYFSLNYVPAPDTLLENIYQLEPGTFLEMSGNSIAKKKWYSPQIFPAFSDYQQAKKALHNSLVSAVNYRLISDVPTGSFLSGGIDSTIISGIAKRIKPDLQTFSIGFPEDPFFDETPFARTAAKFLQTKHEVINVTAREMDESADDVLNYLDHPFADSSCIPLYLLCKKVSSQIRVALSGDGADELFGGYNKHMAWVRSERKSIANSLLRFSSVFLKNIPERRDSKFTNKLRQIKKYAEGLKLNPQERYIFFASFTDEKEAASLLRSIPEKSDLRKILQDFLPASSGLNDLLLSDVKLVLANDMLVKADRMSMASSVEIRPPFLDEAVLKTAFSIPGEWKANPNKGKLILRDTFREFLPEQIQKREKKGFEVPLQRWMETTLESRIRSEWLDDDFIREQGLFDPLTITRLRENIKSQKSNPHTVWAVIVFQNWWKKYMG